MAFNVTSNTTLNQEVTGSTVTWDVVDASLIAFGVIGILGNATVCLVFLGLRRLRKIVTNYFIISLAMADLMASLTLVSQRALLMLPVPPGVGGILFCKFIYSEVFFWISVAASTFNLVGVTLERYLAIVYPFRYQAYFSAEKAIIIIVLSWSFSLCLQIFSFVIYDYDGEYCTIYWSTATGAAVNCLVWFMCTYIAPLCFMTYAYLRIISSLKRDTSNLQRSTDVNKERDLEMLVARRRVIKMLCIVVVTFFVCWTPSQIMFLASFGFGAPIYQEDAVYRVFTVLAFSNSCINPFIYALRNRQFRDGFLVLFCRKDNKVSPFNSTHAHHSSND
ncbi:galanin receptor 2a-like [Saccoglossus kowalevskii]|uniref:Substance-K receptor-like n=1 Tax=Saccoglossus kowalevskii TaxID=10224 RepID=A0ABM0LTU3_SACKO|nr:PREDICTED: substance-K receptor-like [Saccoglossus kowalevskii]